MRRGERHPSKSFWLSLLPSLLSLHSSLSLSLSPPLLFRFPLSSGEFPKVATRCVFFFSNGQCLSNRSQWQSHGNRDGFSVVRDLSMPNAYRLHSAGNVFLYLSFCISRQSSCRRVKTYVRIFSRYFTHARTLSMEPESFCSEIRFWGMDILSRSAVWVVYFSRHWHPLFKFWNFTHPWLCTNALDIPFNIHYLCHKRYFSPCMKDEEICIKVHMKYTLQKYLNISVTMRDAPVILKVIVLYLLLFLIYIYGKRDAKDWQYTYMYNKTLCISNVGVTNGRICQDYLYLLSPEFSKSATVECVDRKFRSVFININSE